VIIARRENSLLFIRIARPAADDEVFLELPRGWANVGESPDEVTTAVRELAEETGLTASNARVLSSYVLDTGIYPQPVTVVACEVAGSAPQLPTDGEADYGSLWISAERLPGLVRDGRIRDGHSLAALAVWNADKNCP
jgi:ADP-ribose pyrophosphatase